MSYYGEGVARTVRQGAVNVTISAWTPLVYTGSTPLQGRRHVKIFVRGKVGAALALEYASKNADGTFTTPTTDIRLVTVYPGNSIIIEPVGDAVNIYGKMLKKVGNTDSSVRVVITEYA